IELAVVQNAVVERAGQRARVKKLGGVDAGQRTAGQVADIVGAGATRTQPQLVDRHQHIEGLGGGDPGDLQIGAGRDVDGAAAKPLGDIGKAARLSRIEDTAGQAQAQHERILVWRDVEQPVELVAKDVEPSGKPAGHGV